MLLYSMPCVKDMRRSGGATENDTDVSDVQYDADGNCLVGISPALGTFGVPGYIDFVSAPDGAPSCRFTCHANAPGATGGARAEVAFPRFAVPSPPACLRSVFRMSVWFGREWMLSEKVSIAQLHRGAALPGRWLFMLILAGGGTIDLTIPQDFASDNYLTVACAPIVPNAWIDIAINQVFAKAASGEAALYIGGASVGAVRGVRTSYDDTSTGPYPKVGIYNVFRHQTGPYMMYLRDYQHWLGPETDVTLGISHRNRRPVSLRSV